MRKHRSLAPLGPLPKKELLAVGRNAGRHGQFVGGWGCNVPRQGSLCSEITISADFAQYKISFYGPSYTLSYRVAQQTTKNSCSTLKTNMKVRIQKLFTEEFTWRYSPSVKRDEQSGVTQRAYAKTVLKYKQDRFGKFYLPTKFCIVLITQKKVITLLKNPIYGTTVG